MDQSATAMIQEIIDQIRTLPAESLPDLTEYVEYLRYKANRPGEENAPAVPLRIVKLKGIVSGYDVSPDRLAEARRDMWRTFDNDLA